MRPRPQGTDTTDAFSEFLEEQPGVWPERPRARETTDSFSEFDAEGDPDPWLQAAQGQPAPTRISRSPRGLVVASVFISLFAPSALVSTVVVSRHLIVSPRQVAEATLPPFPPSLRAASAGRQTRLPRIGQFRSLPAPAVDLEASPVTQLALPPVEIAAPTPVSAPVATPLLPVTTALPSAPTAVEENASSPLENMVPPAVPTATPVAATDLDSAAGSSRPGEVTETASVRAALDRYRKAFSNLDADDAKAVWPAVDEKTLTRAFSQLSQQLLVFDACRIDVTTPRAEAACVGRAQYVPKVGSRTPRVESRVWHFTLQRVEQDWTIVSATSR